jgi:hypothetical protein
VEESGKHGPEEVFLRGRTFPQVFHKVPVEGKEAYLIRI